MIIIKIGMIFYKHTKENSIIARIICFIYNCPIKFIHRGDVIGVSVEQDYKSNCFVDAGNNVIYVGDYKSVKVWTTVYRFTL